MISLQSCVATTLSDHSHSPHCPAKGDRGGPIEGRIVSFPRLLHTPSKAEVKFNFISVLAVVLVHILLP